MAAVVGVMVGVVNGVVLNGVVMNGVPKGRP
jgi:hypothetical protein